MRTILEDPNDQDLGTDISVSETVNASHEDFLASLEKRAMSQQNQKQLMDLLWERGFRNFCSEQGVRPVRSRVAACEGLYFEVDPKAQVIRDEFIYLDIELENGNHLEKIGLPDGRVYFIEYSNLKDL